MRARKLVDRANQPGGWDALHLLDAAPWPSSNEWGIPDLLPAAALPIGRWVGYRDRVEPLESDVLHCFLDDYRFEVVWSRPHQAGLRVRRFAHAVAPDFSQFPEWPKAANLWQTYRAAYIARLWQSWGVNVIPCPNWTGTPEPWQWAGIPKAGPVAVQVPDQRNKATAARFEAGYLAMLAALLPSAVYVVGVLPPVCAAATAAPVMRIATHGERLRNIIK
jgi:Domain of unknown function (DUF4417)